MKTFSTAMSSSELPPHAYDILNVLLQVDGWLSRSELALRLGKARLTPHEIALLERLTLSGMVESSTHENQSPVKYEWIYRAVQPTNSIETQTDNRRKKKMSIPFSIIATINEKGGVGKTTSAVTLAAGLAAAGYRVCLVDFDPQGNATMAVGAAKEGGVYDLIVRGQGFADVVREIDQEIYMPPGTKTEGHLWLIPGNVETRGISQIVDNDQDIVNEVFRALEGVIDVIIFDTSPSPSSLHSGVFRAADYVLLPTLLESFSIDGLQGTLKRLRQETKARMSQGRTETKLLGIVPIMVRNTREHKANLELLNEMYPQLIWNGISQRTAWTESSAARRPIFQFAPADKATDEAQAMVDHVRSVLEHAS
jgi:chromosome partitioning protein